MKHVENLVTVLSIGYALDAYQTILGVILITLNVMLILYRIVSGIYHKIKDHKYNEIDDVLKEGIEALENIKKEED